MKIYTETHNIIYIGNTEVKIVTIDDNAFCHLSISSITIANEYVFRADNYLYAKHIEENKSGLKEALKENGLWQKGIIKAIKLIMKTKVS